MKKILPLMFLLVFTGCSSGGSLFDSKVSPVWRDGGLVKTEVTTSTNGVTKILSSEIKTNEINAARELVGIKNSTITITTTIKVLEQFKGPLVKTNELTIFKTDKFPDNARVTRTKDEYESGRLISRDMTISEPVKQQSSNVAYYIIMVVLGILLLIIIKKLTIIYKRIII